MDADAAWFLRSVGPVEQAPAMAGWGLARAAVRLGVDRAGLAALLELDAAGYACLAWCKAPAGPERLIGWVAEVAPFVGCDPERLAGVMLAGLAN